MVSCSFLLLHLKIWLSNLSRGGVGGGDGGVEPVFRSNTKLYESFCIYLSSRTVPPRSPLKIHIYFHLFKLSIGHNFSQFVLVLLVLADVFTYNIQSKYLQLQEFEKFSIILKEIKPITRFYNKFSSKMKNPQFKCITLTKGMVYHFFTALTETNFSP